MRGSLFALILVCLLCACLTSKQGVAVNEGAKLSPTPILTQKPEEKSEPESKPQQIAHDLLVPVTITKGETNTANDDYELRIEYPQLKQPTTLSERRFNRLIKSLVNKEIQSFENFCRNEKRQRKRPLGFNLNLSYSTNIISPKLICLDLRWSSFTGYLNSDYFTTTINYDLEKGKELKLPDVFKPKSNYLKTLSAVGLRVLKKTCLMCGCEGGISAGARLPQGIENPDDFPAGFKSIKEAVAPKLENFELWSLNNNGITITFDEYEIAPGCAGIISIQLPFEDLKPVLREEFSTNKF